MPQPLHLWRQDLQLQQQLHLVGKPSSLGSVNAVHLGHLVFLKDHTPGALFLADTGASVSLVPCPSSSTPGGRLFTTANGAAIATGPKRSLTHCLKDNLSALHQCNFDFLTGDVEGPILGIDFLSKFHMTANPAAACLQSGNGATFLGILSFSFSLN